MKINKTKELWPLANARSQTERVAATLRQRLLRGEFRPGERLAELTLAPLLNASRTPVRLALERLSPLERAAFLLHDVFDRDFTEVAATLDRSEAACRQLAARARIHVRAARPRFVVSPDQGERLVAAFLGAVQSGDSDTLAQLLAEDAVLHTDGGGRKAAALNLIRGSDRIMCLYAALARKGREVLDSRSKSADN